MKITIVGGGNVGMLLAADLSLVEDVQITVLTRRPQEYSDTIKVINREDNSTYMSNTISSTNEYAKGIGDADMVLCTLTSFLYEDFVKKSEPYLKNDTLLGFIPGFGGAEFACMPLIEKGITVFGLQRVPCSCRVQEYGKISICQSRKPEIFVSSIPSSKTQKICKIMERLLKVPAIPLANYLAVTFTPSNPILHPPRMYDLFKEHIEGTTYTSIPLFYEGWTNEASKILLGCDADVQTLCKKINNLDLSGVRSLAEHYESDTPERLTKKLRSIPSFAGFLTPMVQTGGEFAPDWGSRFFIEDFPYGLAIFKGFALLANHETPFLDKLLFWYQAKSGKEYFLSGGQVGKDISECGAPQRYGFKTLEEVISFY